MNEKKGFLIRRAVPSDQREVESIVEAAYSVYLPRTDKKPFPMLDDYARHIRGGNLFVLEEEGEVLGYAVLLDGGPGTLLLDNIGVRPDCQGKGLGAALIAFAEEQGRARGCSRMTLYTNAVMTENQTLYPHLGFRVTHRAEEDGYRRIYYEKKL